MSRAGVKESLARLDAESWEEYLEALRAHERHVLASADPDEDFSTPVGEFRRSDGGAPLGPGYPTGDPHREGSHREAWMAVVRGDPCSYCGEPVGGTVDHIEPQNGPHAAARGECYTWLNFTGSCGSCNVSKRDLPLLVWLRRRRVLAAPAAVCRAGRTPAKDRRLIAEAEAAAKLAEAA